MAIIKCKWIFISVIVNINNRASIGSYSLRCNILTGKTGVILVLKIILYSVSITINSCSSRSGKSLAFNKIICFIYSIYRISNFLLPNNYCIFCIGFSCPLCVKCDIGIKTSAPVKFLASVLISVPAYEIIASPWGCCGFFAFQSCVCFYIYRTGVACAAACNTIIFIEVDEVCFRNYRIQFAYLTCINRSLIYGGIILCFPSNKCLCILFGIYNNGRDIDILFGTRESSHYLFINTVKSYTI